MTDFPQGVYLSIVIPAYNEENRIGATLRRILNYLNGQSYEGEVLVVVDGSQDRTIEVVREFAEKSANIRVLNNGFNRGKGFAVRRGMLESRGAFLLFSDADLSTPIEEVERLLMYLQNGYDVAIASRGLPVADIRVRQPWWRQLMGRIFNRFVQALVLPGIRDSQCGFKCFPRKVARRVFSRQRIDRFGFDVEVLWIARRLGYRIAEIPVTWINDPLSKVHPIRDSFWMLVDLIRIWYSSWGSSYEEIRSSLNADAMNRPPEAKSVFPVDDNK
jgi:dolichyl-phosphate beta-glucosyltransferase